MIDDKRPEKVKRRCGFSNGLCVSSGGNFGGMGLWWRDINAQIKGYSNHHIEVEVMDNANNPHWREVGVHGQESNNLMMEGRLALVLSNLDGWATNTLGDLKRRLELAEQRLTELQRRNPDAVTQCEASSKEINELCHLQESYWHIWAKANEFRDGDKNSNYFHRKANQRRKRNFIKGLFD
ncbi:A-type inclusion protein A25-like protein [Bienertia sinuspersici]